MTALDRRSLTTIRQSHYGKGSEFVIDLEAHA
jgi:hypothetical protein